MSVKYTHSYVTSTCMFVCMCVYSCCLYSCVYIFAELCPMRRNMWVSHTHTFKIWMSHAHATKYNNKVNNNKVMRIHVTYLTSVKYTHSHITITCMFVCMRVHIRWGMSHVTENVNESTWQIQSHMILHSPPVTHTHTHTHTHLKMRRQW